MLPLFGFHVQQFGRAFVLHVGGIGACLLDFFVGDLLHVLDGNGGVLLKRFVLVVDGQERLLVKFHRFLQLFRVGLGSVDGVLRCHGGCFQFVLKLLDLCVVDVFLFLVGGGDVLHLCFVATKGVGVPLCLLRELGEQVVAQVGGVVHGKMWNMVLIF